jgi:predicted DNA-binding transcriptional regulator AlpA
MPLKIAGLEYLTAAEVCQVVSISRQTLWRWRQNSRIPAGRRFRGQRLVFGQDEVEQIRRYASLLEPADPPLRSRLDLFNPDAKRVGS